MAIKRLRFLNRIFLASPDNSSSSCCKDITIPIYLVSIWQREHKSIICCLSDDRGRIRCSAPASNVAYDRNRTMGGSGKVEGYPVEYSLIQEPHPVQDGLLMFHSNLHLFRFSPYTRLCSAFPKSWRLSNHGLRTRDAPITMSSSAPCREVNPINSASPPSKERNPRKVVKPLILIP
jgi:hypothetical protein